MDTHGSILVSTVTSLRANPGWFTSACAGQGYFPMPGLALPAMREPQASAQVRGPDPGHLPVLRVTRTYESRGQGLSSGPRSSLCVGCSSSTPRDATDTRPVDSGPRMTLAQARWHYDTARSRSRSSLMTVVMLRNGASNWRK